MYVTAEQCFVMVIYLHTILAMRCVRAPVSANEECLNILVTWSKSGTVIAIPAVLVATALQHACKQLVLTLAWFNIKF